MKVFGPVNDSNDDIRWTRRLLHNTIGVEELRFKAMLFKYVLSVSTIPALPVQQRHAHACLHEIACAIFAHTGVYART